MKRFVTVFALLIAIGVIAFAYTGAPVGIWEGLGKNTEKQAFNPDSGDMDAKKIVPIWIYPEIEDGQVFEKTLDSEGVSVTNGTEASWANAGVGTSPVGLKSDENPGDMRGSKFMYCQAVYGAAADSGQTAGIEYSFTGLPKGDYQVNLSVPSNLTINTANYNVCNIAYVRMSINGGAQFTTMVDMSRVQYSGEWIYAGTDTLVLPDTTNTVTVTITNFGEYLDEDTLSEDLSPAIVLADAVRLIKLSTAQMVGSPVAERAGAGSVIINDSDLMFEGGSWQRLDLDHAPLLAAGQMALGNAVTCLRQEDVTAANEARLPFSVGKTGVYNFRIHCPQMGVDIEFDPGFGFINPTGTTSTYAFEIQTAAGGVIRSFTGVTGPQGWLNIASGSTVDLLAGENYYLVIKPGESTTAHGIMFDALKLDLVNEAVSGVFPGNGFPIVYTSINEADDAVDSSCMAHWQGRLCAVNATGDDEDKVAQDIWTYPNKDTSKWGLYEGPVPGGFATTPLVTTAMDPRTGRLEKVLFVGDKSGIFYAFDAAGSDYASGNKTNPRLLFKGPGLFINELAPSSGSLVPAEGIAFGSSYAKLTTAEPNMEYVISAKDRAACGDEDVADENNYKIVDSGFDYGVKIFVPNVPETVGTEFEVMVEYGVGGTKKIKTIENLQIRAQDLGSWKTVDGGNHFARPTRVTVKFRDGSFLAADQIWLYPFTVPGEDLAFGDAAPVADVIKAADGTPAAELACASQVYATTANGRTWCYELSHMWNDDARCIGRLVWCAPNLNDAAPAGGATPLYCEIETDGQLVTFTKRADDPDNTWDLIRYQSLKDRVFSNENSWGMYAPNRWAIPGCGDGPKAISGFRGSDGKWYVSVPTGKADSEQLLVCSLDEYNGDITMVSSGSGPFMGVASVLAMQRAASADDDYKVFPTALNGYIYKAGIDGSGISEISSFEKGSMAGVASDIYDKPIINSSSTITVPQGYWGGLDGYMRAFNLSTGENLNTLIAGTPGHDSQTAIKSMPFVLDNADKYGNSLLGINGADGYFWAYSQGVYDGKYKGRHPKAAEDWQEEVKEEIEEVEPANVADTRADVQVDLVTYEAYKELMKMNTDAIKNRFLASGKSFIESMGSDDNIKNGMISKKMMAISSEDWNYIYSGNPVDESLNNNVASLQQQMRLRLYLLREASKARTSLDVDGDDISSTLGGESRSLMWNTGQKKGRQDNKGIRLEWGDKLYAVVWNLSSGANISSRPFAFLNGPGDSNIRRFTGTNCKNVLTITYPVMKENPGTGEYDPVTINGETLYKVMKVYEMNLDYGNGKLASMVGAGWRLVFQLRNNVGEFRTPVPHLIKSNDLIPFDNVLREQGKDYIVAKRMMNADVPGRAESITVNNPLAIKIDSKEVGDSYDRYDAETGSNGLPTGKKITDYELDFGSFDHGMFTPLKDLFKVADRSMTDVNPVRFGKNAHTIPDDDQFYADPFPWEYGRGSADYPNISGDNVFAFTGDGTEIDAMGLTTEHAWSTASANKDPYFNNRTGKVQDSKYTAVRYQVDIPKYQPAIKKYQANAVIYIDVNGDGKFNKNGDMYNGDGVKESGHDNPADEPYRVCRVYFSVKPDANISLEADSMDFGDQAHGVGYPLAMNGIFYPFYNRVLGNHNGEINSMLYRKPEISRFFQSFSISNQGNVNLYDVGITKQPLFAAKLDAALSMANEGVKSSNAYSGDWKDALRIHENNIVSSLDYRIYSDMDDLNSGDLSLIYPFSSNRKNLNDKLTAGATFTLSKPRVGDTDDMVLTMPDSAKIKGKAFSEGNDYNRSKNGYELLMQYINEPKLAVSVPIGTPVGQYMTKYPLQALGTYYNNEDNKEVTVNSAEGLNLNLNVTEAQVTGQPADRRSALASLYHIGGFAAGSSGKTYFNFDDCTDSAPFAFQAPDGSVGMAWASNLSSLEKASGNSTDDELSLAPSNIAVGTMKSVNEVENYLKGNVSDIRHYYERDKWWVTDDIFAGPDGWPDELMAGGDLQVPYWQDGVKDASLTQPSYFNSGAGQWLTFAGKAQLADADGNLLPGSFENRIFFGECTGDRISVPGEINWLRHLDSSKEKRYPVMTGYEGSDRKWFFYQTQEGGKSAIAYTTDDIDDLNMPTGWRDANTVDGFTLENKVRVPDGISTVGKPNAMPFTKEGKKYMDLVYTGTNTVTGATDVYLTRYIAVFNQNGISGLSEGAQPLPRMFDELRRDAKYDFYVSKGLAWVRQNRNGDIPAEDLPATCVGIGWNDSEQKYNKYIDIYTGKRINDFAIADWENGRLNKLPLFTTMNPERGASYPKFSFDNATNVMTIEYAPGSEAETELGKTLIDFSSGIIRFTDVSSMKELGNSLQQGTSVMYDKPITVYASYVPQTISLTDGVGMNDGGFAFWDEDFTVMTVLWRKTASDDTSNGLYYKVFETTQDANDPLRSGWSELVSQKKVSSDASANINENSISGFYDYRTGGSYGKLWMFWTGTKSGQSAVYYATAALNLN